MELQNVPLLIRIFIPQEKLIIKIEITYGDRVLLNTYK